MEYLSNSKKETIALGTELGRSLCGGEVVLLSGELGAGKTTFTKGIASGIGIKEVVVSPTFTIVKEYDGGRLRLYHMDMYRLCVAELDELGLEDYIGKRDGVSVIEWNVMPDFNCKVIKVTIKYEGENVRRITII